MEQVQQSLIEKVIKQIEHLPTLPQVVTKVLAMTDSAHISAVELSKEMDQTLSAKVLKMANSAYYGGRTARKVNTVHHAIVIIGLDALKEIILTTSLFHTFRDSKEIESLQPLWQHSLECGLAAKRLAWVVRFEAMDEAYLIPARTSCTIKIATTSFIRKSESMFLCDNVLDVRSYLS